MTEKNVGGRPTKYSDELTAALAQGIGKGIPYALVAIKNGIHPDTLNDWMHKGLDDIKEGKDTVLSRFSVAIKATEFNKIDNLLDKVIIGDKGWQGSAWTLERRWREHFGADAGIIQEIMRKMDLYAQQKGLDHGKEMDSGSDKT